MKIVAHIASLVSLRAVAAVVLAFGHRSPMVRATDDAKDFGSDAQGHFA
jgi:hypothetical protein